MAISGKITAARAEVRFAADTSAVKAGIREVERDLKGLQSRSSKIANLGAQVRGLGEGVTRFGRRMSMAGVAAAAPFALAAKAVGDFDREFSAMMVNFGPKLGKTAANQIAGELRGVTKQATRASMQLAQVKKMLSGFRGQTLDIAGDLPVTPQQVARMASTLAKGGLSPDTVFGKQTIGKGKNKTSVSVLKAFAQAASTDLSGAAPEEITENLLAVLKALGKVDDAAGKGIDPKSIMNDVAAITKATTEAQVSFLELTETLKFPGGILAGNIKIDPKQFQELLAVASVLKESLAGPSIAGTSLRGLTLKLRSAQEGDAVSKQLKRFGLGIEDFRSDDGQSFKSIADVVRLLNSREDLFDNKTEFQAAVGGLFDTRQVSAAIKLLDITADKIEERTRELTFGDDESAVKFLRNFTDEMNNNLRGSIIRTQSALGNLGVVLGDTFKLEAMGALEGLIKGIKQLTGTGDGATGFLKENAQAVKRIIIGVGAIVGLGAAISAVGVALSTVSLPIIALGLILPQIGKSTGLLTKGWMGLTGAIKGIVNPIRTAAREFKQMNAAATQGVFAKAEMGRTARATQLPVLGRNVGFDNAMDPKQQAATSAFSDLQRRRKAANAALAASNLDSNAVFKKNKVAETEARKQLARARKAAADSSRFMSPVPTASSATKKRSKLEQAQLKRAKKAVKAFKAENAAQSVSVVTAKKAAKTGKTLAASNKKVSKAAAKAAKANENVSAATGKATKATRKASKGVGLTGSVQAVADNKKAAAAAAKASNKAAKKAAERAAATAAAAALPVDAATEDLRKARAAHNNANASLRRNLKSLGASSALIGGAPKDAASLKRVKVAEANLREAKRQAKRLLNAGKTDLDILRAKKKTLKSMNSGLKSLNQGMGPVLTPGFGALSKSEKLAAANHRFSQSMPILNRRAMGGVIDIAQMKKESKFLKDKPKRIAAANKEFAKTMPILNRRAMGGVIDIAQMKKEAARLSSDRAKLAVGERAKQQAKMLMANQALARMNGGRGAVLNKRAGLGGVIEQRQMEQQAEKANKAQLKRDVAQARSFKAQEIAQRNATGAARVRQASLVPGFFGPSGDRVRDLKQRSFRERKNLRRKALGRKLFERRTGFDGFGSMAGRLKPIPGSAVKFGGKALASSMKNLTKLAFGFAGGLLILGAKFAVATVAVTSLVVASGMLGKLFTAFKEGTKTIQSNFLPAIDLVIASLGALKGKDSAFSVSDFLGDLQTAAKILLLSLARDLPGLVINVVKAIFFGIIDAIKGMSSVAGSLLGNILGDSSGLDQEIAALMSTLGERMKFLADETRLNQVMEDRRLAEITGIEEDPVKAKKVFDEMVSGLKASGAGVKDIQSREDFLRAKAAQSMLDLREESERLTEKFKTAGEVFTQQSSDIAKMLSTGLITPSVAGRAFAANAEEFVQNDPELRKQKELADARAEYTSSLIQQAKELRSSMLPQVQLNETVAKYKEMLKRGLISQKLYNEAVAIATNNANQAETDRLNLLDEINNTKASGFSSSVGQGSFFSRFSANFSSSQGTEQDQFRANLQAEEKVILNWSKIGEEIQGKLPLALTALQGLATGIINPFKGIDFGTLKTLFQNLPDAAKLATSALGDLAGVIETITSKDFQSGKLASSSAEETRKIADKIPDPPKPAPEPPRPASVDQPRSAFLQSRINKEAERSFFGIFMSDSTGENRTNKFNIEDSRNTGIAPGRFSGFRATGGSVKSGGSYIVGEKGPELFFPTESGHILSNGLSKKVDGMFAEGTDDSSVMKAFKSYMKNTSYGIGELEIPSLDKGVSGLAHVMEFLDNSLPRELPGGFASGEATDAFRGITSKIGGLPKSFSPKDFDPTGELKEKFSKLSDDAVRQMADPNKSRLGLDAFKEMGRRDAQSMSDKMQAQKSKAFATMDYKKSQSDLLKSFGATVVRDKEGRLTNDFDLSKVADEDFKKILAGQTGITPSNMSVQGEATRRDREAFNKDLDRRREESTPSNPVDKFAAMQKKRHNLFEKKNKFIDAGGRLSQLEGLTGPKQNKLISQFLKKEKQRVENRELPESPMPRASDIEPSIATSARLVPDPEAAEARKRQRAQRADRKGRMEGAKEETAKKEAEKNQRIHDLGKEGRFEEQGFMGQNTAANRKKHRLAQIRARLAGHSPQAAMNGAVPDAPVIPPVDEGANAKRAGQNAVNSAGAIKQLEMINTALGDQTQLLSKIEGNTKNNGGRITS